MLSVQSVRKKTSCHALTKTGHHARYIGPGGSLNSQNLLIYFSLKTPFILLGYLGETARSPPIQSNISMRFWQPEMNKVEGEEVRSVVCLFADKIGLACFCA